MATDVFCQLHCCVFLNGPWNKLVSFIVKIKYVANCNQCVGHKKNTGSAWGQNRACNQCVYVDADHVCLL